MSNSPKPQKGKTPGAKDGAKRVMENRQARRLNKSEQKAAVAEITQSKAANSSRDRILALCKEHQVPVVPENQERPLLFAKSQAAGGVEMGLQLLIHNPSAMTVDLTTPWCGQNLSENAVSRLLKSLVVPQWARRIKDSVVQSVSRPNVSGMFFPDGSPNKDLRQLLGVFRGEHVLPSHIESARIKAVHKIAHDVISFLSDIEDELFEIVVNSRGEKRVRLKMWTLEQFEQQMSKAIKSSSPGYPYNGCSWQEEIAGYTCIEHARIACESLVADEAVLEGFVFIQQSRATGDGGSGDESDGGGRQRLVMAAPLNEKFIGHLVAYIFKLYARKSPFSGQLGIQEVSRNIKRECQRIIGDPNLITQDYAICDYDVSDWDAAQIHDVMDSDFFAVCDLVFDDEHEFTARVHTNYRVMYRKSILQTGFGQVKTEFLPSGSSITTASAFINHEIKVLIVNDLVTQDRGFPLYTIYGFQGDDNVSLIHKPSDEAFKRLHEVYEAYHCKIKGTVMCANLADENAATLFLNEMIRLRDPVDEDKNAKFPRWTMFWGENFRDTFRGPSIDRMLLEEVLREVPHPTSTELTMVSFCSKMDRFINMPFYTALLNWIRPKGRWAFRSWLGERVCPKSPTILRLKELEESEGIFWPEPAQRALDRREELWANSDELSIMMASLALLVPVSPEARAVANTIISKADNSTAWKRARNAMVQAGVDFENPSGKIPIDDARKLISLSFELGYSSTPQEVDEVVAEIGEIDEDVTAEITETVKPIKTPSVRSMMRGLLALNEDSPYQLRQLYAEAIIGAYNTPAWRSLPSEAVEEILTAFTAMYGQLPDGSPSTDWLNG